MKKIERLYNDYKQDIDNTLLTNDYKLSRIMIARLLLDYEQHKMLHYTTKEFIDKQAATFVSVNKLISNEYI